MLTPLQALRASDCTRAINSDAQFLQLLCLAHLHFFFCAVHALINACISPPSSFGPLSVFVASGFAPRLGGPLPPLRPSAFPHFAPSTHAFAPDTLPKILHTKLPLPPQLLHQPAAPMAAAETAQAIAALGSLLCESSFTSTPTDRSSSNAASLSSTPPTTVSPDSMSLASEPEVPKPGSAVASSIEAAISPVPSPETKHLESGRQMPPDQDAIVVAEPRSPAEPASTGRLRRARSSLPVYNLAKLSGTSVHGRRRANGDAVREKRRRTISGDAAEVHHANDAGQSPRGRGDALGRSQSTASLSTPKSSRTAKKSTPSEPPAHNTRRVTRLSGAPVETMTTKLSVLGKRAKKSVDKGLGRLSRELKRLQDTNEFAHIDTRPVRYTIWSNGKYVDMDTQQEATSEPPRKKVKVDGDAAEAADAAGKAEPEKQESDAPAVKPRRVKKWLEKGLYAGQEAPIDIFKGLTSQERKKLASLPELMPRGKPNRALPMPMFNGLRILINGRDFKLPFDVCNPLPPGQPKPAAYRTMTRSEWLHIYLPCCRVDAS